MFSQTVTVTVEEWQLLPDWAGTLLLAAVAIAVIVVVIRANRQQPAK